MQAERWLAVPGYEGIYEVSDIGRVRSLAKIDAQGARRKQRLFKPSKMDAWGHLGVTFRQGGRRESRYVHRLVLEAFVGPCPPGMEGCHWNDVKDDNRLTNLRWGTKSENRLDCVRNGTDPNARKTHCLRGHPFSEENTRLYKGGRHCLSCQRIADAAYRDRRRAARAANPGKAA